MKYLPTILGAIILLVSCNQSQNREIVEDLRRENDSLTKIIDTLKTKHIFDFATMTSMPMRWKEHENGDVSVHIGYAATNNDDRFLFSTNPKFLNADTLTSKEDFNIVVGREVDTIYYRLLNHPKFGEKHEYSVAYPMKNYR